MIRLNIKWLIIQVCVNLRSISFYLLAILLGLGFTLADSVIKEYNEDTQVLIYSEGSELGEYICAYYEQNELDGFTFTRVVSADELKAKISTGEVSCGVVLDGQSDMYRSQQYAVDIYQTLGSMDGYVLKEIIYPVMNSGTAQMEFRDYLNTYTWDDTTSVDYVVDSFASYMDNVSISLYSVSDIGEVEVAEKTLDQISEDSMENSLRAYVYLSLILLVAIICIYDCLGSNNGFYKAFDHGQRVLLRLETVIITVVMATVMGSVLSVMLERIC